MIRLILILAFLVSPVVSHAKTISFLCKTRDTKEYVDVLSAGDGKVYVQLNGGDFLEGEAEFKDPNLYIYVPVTNGVFVVAFDVTTGEGGFFARAGDKKQSHAMDCKFRQ